MRSNGAMKRWQLLFAVSAVFNWGVGLMLLFAPGTFVATIGYPAPSDFLFVRVSGLLIACLGVCYALIAWAPLRMRPLALLGAVGKIGAVTLFGAYWIAGVLPFPGFALAFGDLGFAAAFLAFLGAVPAERAA